MPIVDFETFSGFSADEMREAFQKVAPKPHWKAEINTVIDESDMAIVDAAIMFITGSHSEFYKTRKKGKVRVVANGYWATIGA